MTSRLRSYLQLLRAPNLFTVPGDPLCGFLLASHGVWSWRAWPAMAICLFAYCFGLVLNDLADFDEDHRERPARPLPSGAISRNAARWLACSLFLMALATGCAFLPWRQDGAPLLLGAVLLYNLAAKKSALTGPWCMGLCRSLSALTGALAGGWVPNWFLSFMVTAAVLVIGLYIAAVSILARTETRNPRIPPLIGALIRGLLFIQAGFCALAGGPAGWGAAALLLALWPLSRLVATRFYAS